MIEVAVPLGDFGWERCLSYKFGVGLVSVFGRYESALWRL
jgi:hypothetical protein